MSMTWASERSRWSSRSNAGSQCHAPKALARLVRLALTPVNQVTEVACRLGQSPLTEPRVDAAFELRHGGPDVASG
jgi:hypothetical protein